MTSPAATLPYAEAAWERSIALPTVDAAFLDAVLAPWPRLRTRRWALVPGGLRHLLLRSDELLLRVALSPEQDVRREAAVLLRVAGAVRVPRVLEASDRALVLEHVPHEDLPAVEEAAARVGRAAARIHGVRFGASGSLDADLRVAEPSESALAPLREYAERAFAGVAGRRLGDLADAVRSRWDREAAAMASACAEAVLVHSDFKPANVKWRPSEHDVLVLDWEFAWSGPALFDLGQFFRWGAPEAFVRAFEHSYRREGGHLPPDWRRTAAHLDLFNLVGLIDDEPARPIRERDVLRRIRETLAA